MGQVIFIFQLVIFRCILEILNIHLHDKEKIESKFFDKSLEILIHNLNNKNLKFAVPRT